MTETPTDDAVEQERDAAPAMSPPPGPAAGPTEANEADALEQATDVPLDEDEYR